MPFYESIYILRPDLATDQIESAIARVGGIISAQGGQILQTEMWGRRDLAYPINKQNKGFYVYHVVEGGGALVRELEGRLKIDDEILKFLNVRVEKPSLAATPMVAPPAEEEGSAPRRSGEEAEEEGEESDEGDEED